jgi:hypothetical protein
MTTRFTARLVSFGLASLMTAAILGGLDFLAGTEPAPGALLAGMTMPKV